MRKVLFWLPLLLFFFSTAHAQRLGFQASGHVRFLGENNDTLPFPFIGGFIAPQFSNVDLNLDGKKDLLVFDRSGNITHPFLHTGNVGEVKYQYAPEYRKFLPRFSNWVLFVDYDGDGKEDIFTSSDVSNDPNPAPIPPNAVKIYHNSSTGSVLKFDLVTSALKEGWPKQPPPDAPFDTLVYTLSVNTSDLPAIADIDNDGDIDILSMTTVGGYVEFWKNYQVEKALPKGEFFFRYTDPCWGAFFLTNTIELGKSCNKYYFKSQAHGGSTLLALDMDNDGDKDLLTGDAQPEIDYLFYLKNGKKELNWTYKGFSADTMISVDTMFPSNSRRAELPVFPAAYYVDINNDGKKDLVVAPNDKLTVKTKNQVWYYQNTGTATVPIFSFVKDNLLQELSVDLGYLFSPALFDYDGDGKKDLVAGTAGDWEKSKNSRDRLVLFKNMGTNIAPVFKMIDSNYLDVHALSLRGIRPAFGDLNNDGKEDLLLGHLEGKMLYYENNSSGALATFKSPQFNFFNIDVGDFCAPFIYDLNYDGKKDLLIGCFDGSISYFRNKAKPGNTFAFATTADVDTLGRMFTADSAKLSNGSWQYFPVGYATPFLFDYKNDSMVEMLAGGFNGKVHSFRIQAHLEGNFTQVDSCFMVPGSDVYNYADFGDKSVPMVADMDGDAVPDLMIGMNNGGLLYYKGFDRGPLPLIIGRDTISGNDTLNSIGNLPEAKTGLRIYPNPGKNYLHIESVYGQDISAVYLFDMGGKMLQESIIHGKQIDINIINIESGIYLLVCELNKKTKHYSKIVVLK